MRRIIAGLLLTACSTAARDPEPTSCVNASDCPPDNICNFGICLEADDVPPQRYVGFDLQDQSQGGVGYRVEIAGCDQEVAIDQATGVRAIDVPSPQMTMFLDLRLFRPTVVDAENPTSEDMLLATFELSQPSRFAREPLVQSADAPSTEGDDVIPTRFTWPRHHLAEPVPPLPDALGPLGHILWRIQPKEPAGEYDEAAAPLYINITPLVADGFAECPEGADDCVLQRECTGADDECCETGMCEPEEIANACIPPGATRFDGVTSGVCRSVDPPIFVADYAYRSKCDRAIEARIVRVDPKNVAARQPIPRADFSVRYANTGGKRLGLPPFGDTWPTDVDQCTRDDHCVKDTQFCNRDTKRCEVSLAGLEGAGGSTAEQESDIGTLRSRVFTYCDPDNDVPLDRAFTVRINPLDETGIAAMTYDVDVMFVPPSGGGDPPPVDLGDGNDLCMPDPGLLSPVSIRPEGAPVQLLTTADGTFTCCDLDCLPNAVTSLPPDRPAACGAKGITLTATAPVKISDADFADWTVEGSGCVPPNREDDGTVGVLSRTAACGEETCDLTYVPLDQSREYSVRFESPTGSVLRSTDTTIVVPEGYDPTTESIPIPLLPRAIVQGRVELAETVCDPMQEDDGDCGSEGAQIFAERLRVGGETTIDTPGPYFHQVATFRDPDLGDGAYVLPLDPGVWLLTALPDPGTAGGPSNFVRVDLRDGLDFVQPLTLEAGILVTLDLATFDRRSLVTPLDIGSWVYQSELKHPDFEGPESRLVDLMAPGECLGDAERGCAIRRLVTGTGLSPTQVGQIRFTARDLGGAAQIDCTTPTP